MGFARSVRCPQRIILHGRAVCFWGSTGTVGDTSWEVEKFSSSSSEKPFNPSPDLGNGASLQGRGKSSVLVNLPPPNPELPGPWASPGCCHPAPGAACPPPQPHQQLPPSSGTGTHGWLVIVMCPWPQGSLFAKGLMFSC